LLAGNPGKRPLNTREPKTRESTFEAPKWLDGAGLDEWRRIADEMAATGAIKMLDEACLAAYCAIYGELVAKKESGELPTPALLGQLRGFMTELGLTPSSRARVISSVEQNGAEKEKRFLA
jgi:phage terminase small subunit